MDLHGGGVRVDVDERHFGPILVDVGVHAEQPGFLRLDVPKEVGEKLFEGLELAFQRSAVSPASTATGTCKRSRRSISRVCCVTSKSTPLTTSEPARRSRRVRSELAVPLRTSRPRHRRSWPRARERARTRDAECRCRVRASETGWRSRAHSPECCSHRVRRLVRLGGLARCRSLSREQSCEGVASESSGS